MLRPPDQLEEKTMNDKRTVAPTEDPVCGMTVDPGEARQQDLTIDHDGIEYAFCGKGCLLEFRDDPSHYLDPSYSPSM
jgi:YHS domain-containing protein